MSKSVYAIKKEQKAELKNEALMLLKTTTGLSKLARQKLLEQINSNHDAKIKSVINKLKVVPTVDKGVKIGLGDLKSQKKINTIIKDIDAFSHGALSKTARILLPFKNMQIKQLALKAKGNKFVQVAIKQRMNKDEIIALGTKLSKTFKSSGMNGSFNISVMTDYGPRYGHTNNFGEEADIFNHSVYDNIPEQDTYKSVSIFFIETVLKPTSGGATNDNNNNCLYDCLSSVLYNKLCWKTPEQLKLYLKINVQAKIDISKMPLIEKALKNIQINVSGDHTYISTVNSVKIINLKLLNGHYSVLNNPENAKLNQDHISFTKRRPIIYDSRSYKNGSYKAYDGTNEILISTKYKSQLYHWQIKEYILVNKSDPKLTLKEDYDLFVKDAKELNTLTKGVIDLFKTGNNKTTALNLFDKYTKHIPKAEHIGQTEGTWITEASIGSIIFSRAYVGSGYYYDVKSMYPSILNSSQTYPIKAGEFKIINESELFTNATYFSYGIYRCHIFASNNNDINKLFRFNKKDKYTHIDLNNAVSLGLSIKLIEDGTANFLYYSRDKLLAGSELFSEFVDILFNLKEMKQKRAKAILNILWGALSEFNTKKLYIKPRRQGQTDQEIDDDCEIIGLMQSVMNEDETIVEIVNNNSIYKTGFARIKPFLIARGRSNISKIMHPYKESIMRCHTDGFICSERPEGIITGMSLGDLVDEGMKTLIKISSCKKAIILID